MINTSRPRRDLSSLPDLLALNTALDNSAEQALTARGSEWVLLTRGGGGDKALVIGGRGVAALAILASCYESVTVYSLDAFDRELQDTVNRLLNVHFQTQELTPEEIVTRLAAESGRYQLIAIDGSLAQLSGTEATWQAAFFEQVAAALTADGQCCVVTVIDPSLAGIRRRRDAKGNASLRQLRQAMSPLRNNETYYFYPDHQRPQEILGWSSAVPMAFKNVVSDGLDKLGLFASLHNSVAIVSRVKGVKPLLQTIADEACRVADLTGPVSVRQVMARDNGTVTIMLDIASAGPAVLRIPMCQAADERLQHAQSGLRGMREQLDWLNELTPEPMSSGTLRDVPYYLEQRCIGVTAESLVKNQDTRADVRDNVLSFLIRFGTEGLESADVDDSFIEQHVTECFAPLMEYSPGARKQLADLCGWVVKEMRGRQVPLVRSHGDLNPTNVVCHPNGAITGVIDWDACQLLGLPMQDIAHFLGHRHRSRRHMNMGPIVVAAISGSLFDAEELGVLKRYREALSIDEDLMVPLLIHYWARHFNLHVTYRNGPLRDSWLDANFYKPLQQLCAFTS